MCKHRNSLASWYSVRLTTGTSMLWVEGQRSSSFLPVKMSIPTRWTLAPPCLPVLEVDISTILQGRPLITTYPFFRRAEHCIGKVADAPESAFCSKSLWCWQPSSQHHAGGRIPEHFAGRKQKSLMIGPTTAKEDGPAQRETFCRESRGLREDQNAGWLGTPKRKCNSHRPPCC